MENENVTLFKGNYDRLMDIEKKYNALMSSDMVIQDIFDFAVEGGVTVTIVNGDDKYKEIRHLWSVKNKELESKIEELVEWREKLFAEKVDLIKEKEELERENKKKKCILF